MRVLVCGGRDYRDQAAADRSLDAINAEWIIDHLIHGDARGADHLADSWAVRTETPVTRYPANWDAHGKAAGPMRNQRMLDEGKPDLVVAFPGGRGTEDMKRRARLAGMEVIEIG